MKMKKIDIAILVMILVVIVFCIVVFFITNEREVNFIEIGQPQNLEVNDYYVFTNYNDFKAKYTDNVSISKESFNDSNYLLLKIKYNSCSDQDVTPSNYYVSGDKIKVIIKYKESCGYCASLDEYYLLKIDKNLTNPNVNIEYKATSREECNSNGIYKVDKPLIYLYPTVDLKVNVKLGRSEALTSTYPKYKDSWNVLAKPDGELVDDKGRSFYGLYWEGYNTIDITFEDGFVVGKDDLIPFLEEKLSILGLTEREANEFIIYWLPKLEENEYNLIRFESIDKINKDMPLIINPNPDTVIRVLMEYKKADKATKVKTQELVTPVRKGFTVVEWGGTLVK